MRMTVDLQESIRTPLGSGRYWEGEYDQAVGVLWVEGAGQGVECTPLTQHEGRRVGIVLVSRVVVTVDAPKPKAEAKKP
jgi:hypothetical protein